MQFLSKYQIIEKIKRMPIFDDEYDIILSLSNTLSPELFIRVLEEVLAGNLTFSDFKEIFPGREYRNILEKTLKNESEILDRLKKYLAFKAEVQFARGNRINIDDQKITLTIGNKQSDVYEEEIANFKNSLIYTLFEGSSSDTNMTRLNTSKDSLMTRIVKDNLINRIKNSNLIVNYTPLSPDDGIPNLYENDQGRVSLDPVYEKRVVLERLFIDSYGFLTTIPTERKYNNEQLYKTLSDTITIKSRNLSPDGIMNKILFFTRAEILPLEVDDQILTAEDYEFMKRKAISEDQMKKMKALSLFIKIQNVDNLEGDVSDE